MRELDHQTYHYQTNKHLLWDKTKLYILKLYQRIGTRKYSIMYGMRKIVHTKYTYIDRYTQ